MSIFIPQRKRRPPEPPIRPLETYSEWPDMDALPEETSIFDLALIIRALWNHKTRLERRIEALEAKLK